MSLYNRNLWTDELSQLQALQGSFLDLIKVVPSREFCSYLSGDFYLMFPFFKLFGYNKWGLVIPHLISTIIGFYLLYLICKRYFKSIWTYLITFIIVCFNATLIFHATEIRPYAVLPTLALAAFYLLDRLAELDFRISGSKRFWASAFFILLIWFHAYGLLMFGCFLLYQLLIKYRKGGGLTYLKNAFFLFLPVFLITMPLWLVSVFGPHSIPASYNQPTFEYIPSPLKDTIGFLKGIFCNIMGNKKLYFLFILAGIPFIFSYPERRKQLFFLLINVFLPIGLIFTADYLSRYSFIQRQFIWIMPLFAFFLGWAWDAFYRMIRLKFSKN